MNQKGFIKDIVIIVLAILLLGGGYFYFSKKPAYAPSENSATNQKVADETAGWEIYTNDYFSFKYPSLWSVRVRNNSIEPDISFVEIGPKETIQSGGLFAVSLSRKSEEQFIGELNKVKVKIIQRSDISLDGNSAQLWVTKRFPTSESDGLAVEWENIVYSKNGLLFIISKSEPKDIFSNFLNSFHIK